jgi:hypothetical protein
MYAHAMCPLRFVAVNDPPVYELLALTHVLLLFCVAVAMANLAPLVCVAYPHDAPAIAPICAAAAPTDHPVRESIRSSKKLTHELEPVVFAEIGAMVPDVYSQAMLSPYGSVVTT